MRLTVTPLASLVITKTIAESPNRRLTLRFLIVIAVSYSLFWVRSAVAQPTQSAPHLPWSMLDAFRRLGIWAFQGLSRGEAPWERLMRWEKLWPNRQKGRKNISLSQKNLWSAWRMRTFLYCCVLAAATGGLGEIA
ncbi:hypothetical protein ASPWEDRAFT_638863 [Aspergillus wentii DTO 134E9]|uniref:Uncharacterized protein n=1 Tax=Aspergillus wentii DTO 134E9 TaxID=1073089 RepID=A0A1L9RAB1_ASPWE|nr:uncharacterized protein ASPWEDRAFT_638863 [Aspergillus wentii DTO 134E9]OJJ31850.1 hypothetical protein ASPWEDRAFT_638863 [Aspergillus wentii DTO 134E9]